MPSAGASGAICVQRFDDSLTSCNSHYVSHFAAFFIVARAKISVVESFGCLFFFSEESGDKSQRKMALALCLVCTVIFDFAFSSAIILPFFYIKVLVIEMMKLTEALKGSD